MTLASGKGWIPPTRKQEIAMSTKPVKGIRLDKKSGQIVKTPPRMAAGQKRNKALKTARLAKKWAEKSKGAKP